MKTSEIRALLRQTYAQPEYGVIEEVANATGFDGNRYADALVQSLWPSRGLELWGIEIKASRADWMKEKKSPEKAESIAAYCDRWYIVAGDEKIVRLDENELPAAWGLMVPRGGRLKIVREATKSESPKAIDRKFLASIFRRCSAPDAELIESSVAIKVKEQLDASVQSKLSSIDWRNKHLEKELRQLNDRVHEFERASGLTLAGWANATKTGEAVRAVEVLRGMGAEQLQQRIWKFHSDMERTLSSMKMQIDRERDTLLSLPDVLENSVDPSTTAPATHYQIPVGVMDQCPKCGSTDICGEAEFRVLMGQPTLKRQWCAACGLPEK